MTLPSNDARVQDRDDERRGIFLDWLRERIEAHADGNIAKARWLAVEVTDEETVAEWEADGDTPPTLSDFCGFTLDEGCEEDLERLVEGGLTNAGKLQPDWPEENRA